VFPLHDDNPTRSTPVVTFALIAINVAVFLWQMFVVGLDQSAWAFGLIPVELTQNPDFIFAGRGVGLPPGVEVQNLNPPLMTIFTSMFMHGSWLHIIGNMWYLWIFGNNIEDALGKTKFILFYLVCGVAAAMAQVVLDPSSRIPMVGASGALAGVLGAYLVLFSGSRVLCLITAFIITTIELPASIVLGFWFVLQVINGVIALGPRTPGGGVAFAAHVGGFVAGWLLIRVMGAHPHLGEHAAEQYERYQRRAPSDFRDWR
jgi:membrane associated rhomboid family serine protease